MKQLTGRWQPMISMSRQEDFVALTGRYPRGTEVALEILADDTCPPGQSIKILCEVPC